MICGIVDPTAPRLTNAIGVHAPGKFSAGDNETVVNRMAGPAHFPLDNSRFVLYILHIISPTVPPGVSTFGGTSFVWATPYDSQRFPGV